MLLDTPTPSATVIADDACTTIDGTGGIYHGPCPAQTKEQPHHVVIDRNYARCEQCGVAFKAQPVFDPWRGPYLKIQF